MNAAELRALGARLTKIVPADLEAAAEILELLAWAEERKVHVERYGGMWFIFVLHNEVEYGDHSFISTLRRAREASK